jgi:hypothetical protein
MARVFPVLLAMSVCVGVNAQETPAGVDKAVVVRANAKVYKSPSLRSPVLDQLSEGAGVTIDFRLTASGPNWCSINSARGVPSLGFVDCADLKVTEISERRALFVPVAPEPAAGASGSAPEAPSFSHPEEKKLADPRGTGRPGKPLRH